MFTNLISDAFGHLREKQWQELAAVMYQAAGAYDMPTRVLDLLAAAQRGEPFNHLLPNILPVFKDETKVPDITFSDSEP